MSDRLQFRPRLERLEEIIAPAGFSAKVNHGGQLIINGTNEAENVTVTPVAAGQFSVKLNNVDVAGSPFSGVSAIKINLKGGNDSLSFAQGTSGFNVSKDVSVDLGKGDDYFTIEASFDGPTSVGGNFKILAGAGNDFIQSSANDTVVVGKLATVNLGAGNDLLLLHGVSVGRANILGGAGNDDIRVGGGDEHGTAGVVASGAVSVDAGVGDDFVQVHNLQTTGKATLKLGNGNDTVYIAADSIEHLSVGHGSSINGGPGHNGINTTSAVGTVEELGTFVKLLKVAEDANVTFRTY